MERRDWSLELIKQLQYIDSLEDDLKGKSLVNWVEKYLVEEEFLNKLTLSHEELQNLSELFYKNITFLKNQSSILQSELKNNKNIQKFLV